MIVGCYTLDLYCDSTRTHEYEEDMAEPAQFTGQTERECWRKAREVGWKKRGVYAFCPKCVRLERAGELKLVPRED